MNTRMKPRNGESLRTPIIHASRVGTLRKTDSTSRKPIYCEETGQKFESVIAAAEHFKGVFAMSTIAKAARTGRKIKGVHFRYL